MPTLESRMVLHRFMCNQFGYQNLREILNRLDGLPKGFIDGNTSRFSQALATYMEPRPTTATRNDLTRYDDHIIAHSKTLGMTDEQDKSWKPFQYLALLFTERYLDLYFQDRENLVNQLNQWIKKDTVSDMPEYTLDDIHTLAFQSATGSGENAVTARQCSAIQALLKRIQTVTQTQQNHTGHAGRGAFPSTPAGIAGKQYSGAAFPPTTAARIFFPVGVLWWTSSTCINWMKRKASSGWR